MFNTIFYGRRRYIYGIVNMFAWKVGSGRLKRILILSFQLVHFRVWIHSRAGDEKVNRNYSMLTRSRNVLEEGVLCDRKYQPVRGFLVSFQLPMRLPCLWLSFSYTCRKRSQETPLFHFHHHSPISFDLCKSKKPTTWATSELLATHISFKSVGLNSFIPSAKDLNRAWL